MKYRLTELADLCDRYNLRKERAGEHELKIHLREDCTLIFHNLDGEPDSVAGFEGCGWHWHDTVQLMTGEATYIECDELDIIEGLMSGELVIVSQHKEGKLCDRWIMHRDERLKVGYIDPGEELTVYRLDPMTKEGG